MVRIADSYQRRRQRLRSREIQTERKPKLWRTDPPKFDDEGKLLIGGMWPSQKVWWELQNFIKILVGGYGFGKTIQLSKRAIASALHNAPCKVAVVSPTYGMALDTTVATIAGLLEGKRSLNPSLRWRYNENKHRFTIRFRGRVATIIILSGDNPIRLKGPNLAAAYIDEPFIQDFEVFSQMQARVRHPRAKLREIALTGTPEQLNWGYDLVEGELAKNYDSAFVRGSTRENVALDPDYVRGLERAYDVRTAQAYIDGYFVNLAKGRMFYAFGADNIVKLGIPPGVEIGAGMDFNVNPMTAALFWRSGDHIHFFDEYEIPNADTEHLCGKLIEDYRDLGLTTIYPDPAGRARKTAAPAGRSDFDIIKRMGFEIESRLAHPPRRDRFNSANGKMRARDGRVSFTVEPPSEDGEFGCPKLIKYLQDLTEENKSKTVGEAMTHLTDAATYPVEFLFPVGRDAFKIKKLRGA